MNIGGEGRRRYRRHTNNATGAMRPVVRVTASRHRMLSVRCAARAVRKVRAGRVRRSEGRQAGSSKGGAAGSARQAACVQCSGRQQAGQRQAGEKVQVGCARQAKVGQAVCAATNVHHQQWKVGGNGNASNAGGM